MERKKSRGLRTSVSFVVEKSIRLEASFCDSEDLREPRRLAPPLWNLVRWIEASGLGVG